MKSMSDSLKRLELYRRQTKEGMLEYYQNNKVKLVKRLLEICSVPCKHKRFDKENNKNYCELSGIASNIIDGCCDFRLPHENIDKFIVKAVGIPETYEALESARAVFIEMQRDGFIFFKQCKKSMDPGLATFWTVITLGAAWPVWISEKHYHLCIDPKKLI